VAAPNEFRIAPLTDSRIGNLLHIIGLADTMTAGKSSGHLAASPFSSGYPQPAKHKGKLHYLSGFHSLSNTTTGF
jgi:hypothetical protein